MSGVRSLLSLVVMAGLLLSRAPVAASPTFPHEDHGACPFECCQYGPWVVQAPIVARQGRATTTAVAFRVAAGERVEALSGVVVTTRPGRAVAVAAVERDGVRIERGAEVPVLRYAGEGAWVVWAGGRPIDAEEEAAGGSLRLLSRPQTAWWVQIRSSRGQVGWSNEAQRFEGADACR